MTPPFPIPHATPGPGLQGHPPRLTPLISRAYLGWHFHQEALPDPLLVSHPCAPGPCFLPAIPCSYHALLVFCISAHPGPYRMGT